MVRGRRDLASASVSLTIEHHIRPRSPSLRRMERWLEGLAGEKRDRGLPRRVGKVPAGVRPHQPIGGGGKGDGKARPESGRLSTSIIAQHALDDPAADGRPEPRPAMACPQTAIALLEIPRRAEAMRSRAIPRPGSDTAITEAVRLADIDFDADKPADHR